MRNHIILKVGDKVLIRKPTSVIVNPDHRFSSLIEPIGWVDDMVGVIGKVGVIVNYQCDDSIDVQVDGRQWVYQEYQLELVE